MLTFKKGVLNKLLLHHVHVQHASKQFECLIWIVFEHLLLRISYGTIQKSFTMIIFMITTLCKASVPFSMVLFNV